MEGDRARLTVLSSSPNESLTLDDSSALAPLSDIPVTVTIRLGRTRLALGELMALQAGAVLGLDQPMDAPAEIMVGDKVIALGQMVMVGKELGVRVLELASVAVE